MESFIADAIDDDADLICVDALYDLAVETLAISIPLVYQGKQLEWKSCIPCSSKEEAWEKWKDLRGSHRHVIIIKLRNVLKIAENCFVLVQKR